MYETVTVRLVGASPLLLKNARHFLDPVDPLNKELKRFTKKRTKTDADHAEIGKLEWMMSLYLDEKGRLIIPAENVEQMLANAAAKRKRKKDFLAAVFCDGNCVLEYDGPKDPEKLYDDVNFIDRRRVVNKGGGGAVLRTRPRFNSWAITAKIKYLPEQVDRADVIEAAEVAGQIIGLGDYRPRFGQFSVEVSE